MATQGVEFADVSFDRGVDMGAGGRRLLSNVSLKIAAGTTTALIGRSGSGKTTLLRTVNGLVRPTAGEVLVGGKDVAGEDVVALRRGIGYVIQETGLFPQMKVERNVGLALELAGVGRAEIGRRAAEVLQMVGLPADLMERYPWQLSGGQRQRVGLARALAAKPQILLMDEPFGALDPLTRAEMQTMLKKVLREVGTTTLIVTHDLDEALYLAERVVLLEAGKVVADLASGDVRASEIAEVKAYVAATRRADFAEEDVTVRSV
jgi:osmoprotectant transport system ATP-binding protein